MALINALSTKTNFLIQSGVLGAINVSKSIKKSLQTKTFFYRFSVFREILADGLIGE